jgi:hypothetical protein
MAEYLIFSREGEMGIRMSDDFDEPLEEFRTYAKDK